MNDLLVTPHPHSRPRRRGRTARWTAIMAGLIAIVAAAGFLLVAVSGPAAPARAAGPAQLAAAHYYQWPGGEAPQGITLSGLQAYLMTPTVVPTLEHQMLAAKTYWHATYIRLQVTQDRLVGANGAHFRPAYMAKVRQTVDYGLSLGLNIVINAQTELQTGYQQKEPLPTRATYAFWGQAMRFWANNPRVTFDLFNEPRRCTWGQWDDAMQGLVSFVRGAGAHNPIWVEGRWWGSTLAGVPLLHQPAGNPPIVYTIHHPGAPWDWQANPTKATWDAAFGSLAARGIPVVDGEFANYVGSYDWQHSARTVRAYLAYLTSHHVGMLAWSLLPGALNSTLDYRSVSRQPQGDGAQVRRWFASSAKAATR